MMAKWVKPFSKVNSALRSSTNSLARSTLVNAFPLNET
jgi:hypothetical protein